MAQTWALIVAAGQGRRFGRAKALATVAGRPMLAWSVDAFQRSRVDGLLVVAREEDLAALADWSFRGRPLPTVAGAGRRQDSVAQGLSALPSDVERVLVHDAARPLVTPELIARVMAASALAAMPVVEEVDTIRRQRGEAWVLADGKGAMRVQTPQAFSRPELARRLGERADLLSDDAELFARTPGELVSVEGDPLNLKITVPSDLTLAEAILAQRGREPGFRVGHGYDVHLLRLGKGPLTLGGVPISAGLELIGHSDADVLLHALADAILGAAGLADIGHYFPPGEARTAGMDSAEIVRAAQLHALTEGLEVAQVDLTVAAEAPRLGPHREAIRREVAGLLGIPPGRVGLKATTEEGAGGATSPLAVKVWALALLSPAR